MARFVLLAVIGAGVYWWLRSGRGSIERLLPPLAIGLALLYLVAPVDLVPDAGLVGLLDDVAVLVAAVLWARRRAYPRPQSPHGQSSEPAGGADVGRDPHEILGVRRGASAKEITSAYREKMKLYHPDRVNGLGEELQRVATQKTIEIQRAYDSLRQTPP